MSRDYNLINIHSLLVEGFTEAEVRRFCSYQPDFRPLYNQLSAKSSLAEIADQLIDYSQRKLLLDKILLWAKQKNLRMYEQHQPYFLNELGEYSTPSQSLENAYLIKLHGLLDRYFDEEELRTLCFILNVDFDSLRGEGKTNKARELLLYLNRRDRIVDLVEACKKLRPHTSWDDR